jgi:hypothetical protein
MMKATPFEPELLLEFLVIRSMRPRSIASRLQGSIADIFFAAPLGSRVRVAHRDYNLMESRPKEWLLIESPHLPVPSIPTNYRPRGAAVRPERHIPHSIATCGDYCSSSGAVHDVHVRGAYPLSAIKDAVAT